MNHIIYEAIEVGSDWRVEAINHEREGEMYVTIFVGLNREARAREYAEFKNRGETDNQSRA